jgi:hypothetical protein
MRRLLIVLVLLLACQDCSRPAAAFTVLDHPDGPLYVGDKVSFEVLAPAAFQAAGEVAEVHFQDRLLGESGFQPFGIGGRIEAVLPWVWDTHGLPVAAYLLTFRVLPQGTTWTESYRLLPASQVPPPEPAAHWTSTSTVCCTIYTITGTAANRDLRTLGALADEQSAEVAAQFHTHLPAPIPLTFLPRVLGHGGFTSDGVYVSYVDGNYMDGDMGIILHHEFVHFYDGLLGGEFRPSILQEGLAVYLSGGHFKPEPIPARAAALLQLGWYIPLRTLADTFYTQQHEIGYVEAAGLVDYLVATYGWEAFNGFYRAVPSPAGSSPSEAMDRSLRQQLGISFDEMEAGYRAFLKKQTVPEPVRTDLQMSVRFYTAADAYQQKLDPSAYFMNAWLPEGTAMRSNQIVADLLRHPQAWDNRLVEALLLHGQDELSIGNYRAVGLTLEGVDWLLPLLPK